MEVVTVATSNWSRDMDRRIEQMRRDPVQYLEVARREARRGNPLTASVSSRRTQQTEKREPRR